ncbi:MAG: hypothetical protein AAF492_32865, partial [Verrucomicrobiota bacterium]
MPSHRAEIRRIKQVTLLGLLLSAFNPWAFGESDEYLELEKKVDALAERIEAVNQRMERKLAELDGSMNIMLKLLQAGLAEPTSQPPAPAVSPTPSPAGASIRDHEVAHSEIEDNKIVNFSFEEGIGLERDTEAIVGWSMGSGKPQRIRKYARSGRMVLELPGHGAKKGDQVSVFQDFPALSGRSWRAGVYIRHNLSAPLEEHNQ